MTTVEDVERVMAPDKTGRERPCHRGNPATGKTLCGLTVKDPRPHSPKACREGNHVRCPVCHEEEFFGWT